jgi:membrane protein implicated in regulation of membrane protease activity
MLLICALIGLFFIPYPWNVIAVVVAAIIDTSEIYLWKRYLRRYKIKGGSEGMIGQRAEVTADCAPEGQVRARGEIWKARAPIDTPLARGDRAVVTGIDGLTLELAPVDEPWGSAARFSDPEGA